MLRRVVLAHRYYSDFLGLSLCLFRAHHHPFIFAYQRCLAGVAIAPRNIRTCPGQRDASANTPATQAVKCVAPNSDVEDPFIVSLVQFILSRHEGEHHKLRRIRSSTSLSNYLADVNNVRKLAGILASTKPVGALQFLALIQKLGYRLEQNVYEYVCLRLANSKQWLYILDVVSSGLQQTGRTTSRLLNWKARSLLELERYGLLHDVLDEFEGHNLKPKRRTYHLVLTGHLRNSDVARARQCLQQMEEAEFPPDSSTYALLATNYRRLGPDIHVESYALRALGDIDSASSVAVLNSLIQSRLDFRDTLGALHLLAYFTPSSTQAFVTSLSRIHNSVGMIESNSSHMTHPSPRQLLKPDASTYAIIINYLTSHVGSNGMTDILHAMARDEIKPSPAVIISLINTYASSGYINVAARLVASTCDRQKTPWKLFAPLVSKTHDLRLPLECTDVPPSAPIFNAFLEHALQLNGLKAMSIILRAMRNNGVTPNSATVEIFTSYLRKKENIRPRLVLRTLRQLFSSGISPSSHHLHSILSCVLRYEKYLLYGSGWNVAASRLSHVRQTQSRSYPERRVTGTSEPFDPTAGLQLPRYMGYQTLFQSVVRPLSSHRIKSDAAVFALRIRHEAVIKADLESAENAFRALLSRGIHATVYHYSALIEGYALKGDMDQAEAVLKSMKEVGLKPNVLVYTILINGYGRRGDPERALKMFQRMIYEGINPDIPTIDALCAAFFIAGTYAIARRMLISCWEYIQPFPNEFRYLSLQELAIRFRSLHKGNHSVPKPMSKRQRRILYFKVRGLVQQWTSSASLSTTRIPRHRRLDKYKKYLV